MGRDSSKTQVVPLESEGASPLTFLLIDQRRRWQEGEHVLVEQILHERPALKDEPANLLELIYHEFLLREERQDVPLLEEYLGRFPQFAKELRLHHEVHAVLRSHSNGDSATAGITNTRNAIAGYEILDVLGRGGMGIVYKARQLRPNRIVALKMILAAEHAEPEMTRRFCREAEAVARLQHPNIVQIHEFGEDRGRPYFSLEYVDGVNLAQFLQGAPISARDAARLVLPLAHAIHHAHERGIVHRDLKPANILLMGLGIRVASDSPILDPESVIPKIADFGLAKMFNDLSADPTRSGDLLGTPSYMAPEQIVGKSGTIGPAADVYGVGAILYELLTGRPPFRAETPMATLEQVRHDEPVSPSRLQPRCPRDLVTICLKCLHKEPRQRYSSAATLADDLQRFIEGRPIRARPVGAAGRLARWCWRKPLVASLLALVGALVCVVLVGAPLAAIWLHQARLQALHEKADAIREAAAGRRFSQQSGQRFVSLAKLADAARNHPSLELRNEAIACMALPDLHVLRQWDGNPRGDWTVSFDHELRRYAFVDPQGRICVHDVETEHQLCCLESPGVPATHGPRFSPDGRYLVSPHTRAGPITEWRIWDVERQQVVQVLPTGTTIHRPFEFRPDSGGWAVGQTDENIALYDAGLSQPVKVLASMRGLENFCFRPHRRHLAVSSVRDGRVEIRDIDTDNVVTTLTHQAGVRGLAWSPDGTSLATGCDDHRVYIWNVDEGRTRAVMDGHQGSVIFLAFHPSGEMLISGSWDNTSRLWDVRTGRMLVRVPGVALGFSPDGNTLAFRNDLQIGLWQVSTAQECRTLHHAPGDQRSGTGEHAAVWGVDFSPDGRILASAGAKVVRLWSLLPLWELAHFPVGVFDTVRFHPDGSTLLTFGQRGLNRWPLQPEVHGTPGALRLGQPQLIFPKRTAWDTGQDFCWDRWGHSVLVMDDVKREQAFVLPLDRPGEPVLLRGAPRIVSVALSPDGRWAALGALRHHGVKVFDAHSGDLAKRLPTGDDRDNGATVTFSADGKWLVTGGQKTYRFWEVGTWEPGLEIKRERNIETSLGRMAFSPDGGTMAIAWSTHHLRLLNPTTGAELATLTAPDPQPITRLCFSPDGTLLAAATGRDVIQLWDLRLIREQLAAMNLDWERPPYPPAVLPDPLTAPLRVRVITDGQATASRP